MNNRLTILILLAATALIGCAPMLYKPASSDPAEQEKLLAGRKLYVSNCGSCHNLHLPNKYTSQVWKKNLDEMQEKSKITDTQKELIFVYLTSAPGK